MDLQIYKYYDGNGGATILISLAIILFAGFAFSKIAKLLKLPNVTGYIIAGIIIGPYVLDLVPHNIISNMSFLSDLALGFIAFGVGKSFKKEVIKASGMKVIIITLLEALLAGVLVSISIYLIFPNMGLSFALLLGGIATATAPASTMMTIKQYKAKGEFVDILLQVVALDDVVCLLAFSIITAVIEATNQGNLNVLEIVLPIIYNLGFMLIGLISGLVLPYLIKNRSSNSKMIMCVCFICLISGCASLLDISPLLSCMIFGASYINKTKDKELFNQIDDFDPPIMLAFFVISGMNMDLSSFLTIGMIGLVYFIIRILGKYLGAYLGCKIVKVEKKTTRYLGFGLIPQAGVAIGLAFLGQRMLPNSIGDTFLSVILCSSVLYEMIGPVSSKFALIKSGAIDLESVKLANVKEVENKQKQSDKLEQVQVSENKIN